MEYINNTLLFNSTCIDKCADNYTICSSLFDNCTEICNEICEEENNTNITDNIHNYYSQSEIDWYFLAFVVILMAAGAVGNVLVCLAVCTDRTLQNSTNYFLLSLAFADLLVSLCVMPLGAIPSVIGYWPLGIGWCSVYVTSDVLACTSSILHMCVISLGRYMGIRSPLRARHHRHSKRYLAKKVACVWILAAFISSSITVLGAHDRKNIMPVPGLCAINNRSFQVFGSMASFYLPMILMVGSYILTLHLLRRKAKFGAKARAQRLLQQGRPVSNNPNPTSSQRVKNNEDKQTTAITSNGSNNKNNREQPPSFRTLRIRAPSQLSYRLSENKASTVLGLVFASFVLCWAPFFILNVLAGICPSCVLSAPPGLLNACLWLGYGSSCINPIIYTVFNRSFRAALLRILCCKGPPPPPIFRSMNECRTITGNNSSIIITSSTPTRTSSSYPATFDILP